MATREEVIAACDAFPDLIDTVLPDNTNREISAADVRSALEYLNDQIRSVSEAVKHWEES